jgi:hypothetical protein
VRSKLERSRGIRATLPSRLLAVTPRSLTDKTRDRLQGTKVARITLGSTRSHRIRRAEAEGLRGEQAYIGATHRDVTICPALTNSLRIVVR